MATRADPKIKRGIITLPSHGACVAPLSDAREYAPLGCVNFLVSSVVELFTAATGGVGARREILLRPVGSLEVLPLDNRLGKSSLVAAPAL